MSEQKAQEMAALREAVLGARKRTSMTTVYDMPEGVVVDGTARGERIEVDRVVVEVDDTGDVSVNVKGYTLTKSGKRKIGTPYAYADFAVVKAVTAMLNDRPEYQ